MITWFNELNKQDVITFKSAFSFSFQLETQIPAVVERSSQNWVWLIGVSITAGVILLIILVGVLWCVSILIIDIKTNHYFFDLHYIDARVFLQTYENIQPTERRIRITVTVDIAVIFCI